MRTAIMILLFSAQAWSANEYLIFLKKDLPKYKTPQIQSSSEEVFSVDLSPLKARLSTKKYFLEVFGEDGYVMGYIYTKDLKGAKIRRIKAESSLEKTFPSKKNYNENYGLGLRALYTTMKQGGYSDTISEVDYQFSDFESNTLDFELQLGLPSRSSWNYRFSFIQRSTNFKSTSETVGIQQEPVEVERKQKLIGIGLNGHYYFAEALYFLLSIELGKGTEVDLKFGGQRLATTDTDLPFFALVGIGIGYDFQIFENWYLNPEIKLGADLNSDPLTSFYSIALGVNKSF